ncbi:MAG: DUF2341 domain-containing protein, partial [Verrucomicrobiota bacterium]
GMAQVWVFHGPTDGGTNPAAWDQLIDLGLLGTGAFFTTVSNLTNCRTYYFRTYATNSFGEAWAPSTEAFEATEIGAGLDVLPVTDLSSVSAVLNGRLTTSSTVARAWLYYGTSDGGTSPSSWENEIELGEYTNSVTPFSFAVPGLTTNTTVYYALRASNCAADVWTPSSESFTTPAYSNRMKISFCAYTGTSPLTNFPVFVQLGPNITDFDYASFSSPSGGDLRFFDASETVLLDHDIETWDTNGVSHIWVEVPRLEDSVTHIYAKWGSTATNPPTSTTNGATWSANYRGVWHLSETVTDNTSSNRVHRDASTNAFHADQRDNGTVTGFIGNAQGFDGAGDQIRHDYSPILNPDSVTLSGWIWLNTRASYSTIVSSRDSGEDQGYSLFHQNEPLWSFVTEGGTGTDFLSIPTSAEFTQTWIHVGASYDQGLGRVYINGRLEAESAMDYDRLIETNPFLIGAGFDEGTGYYFVGRIDVVRIAGEARSEDWMFAAWLNMASNHRFNCYELNTNRLRVAVNPLPA